MAAGLIRASPVKLGAAAVCEVVCHGDVEPDIGFEGPQAGGGDGDSTEDTNSITSRGVEELKLTGSYAKKGRSTLFGAQIEGDYRVPVGRIFAFAGGRNVDNRLESIGTGEGGSVADDPVWGCAINSAMGVIAVGVGIEADAFIGRRVGCAIGRERGGCLDPDGSAEAGEASMSKHRGAEDKAVRFNVTTGFPHRQRTSPCSAAVGGEGHTDLLVERREVQGIRARGVSL